MASASVSAVLRGWLRSGEVGLECGALQSSNEVTTTIHLCVSRVSRGADRLELSISSRSTATAERKRDRQRESASRRRITTIDGAEYAASDSPTYRDRDTFVRTASSFTDA